MYGLHAEVLDDKGTYTVINGAIAYIHYKVSAHTPSLRRVQCIYTLNKLLHTTKNIYNFCDAFLELCMHTKRVSHALYVTIPVNLYPASPLLWWFACHM